MALPLKVANRVIGALDVQSMEQSAFSKEDIDLLSTLADQVAVAIENVRLFSETRIALAELQSLHHQYLKTEWQEEAKESKRSGYELQSGAIKPISIQNGLEKWIDVETGAPVVLETEENGKSLVAPISIRGQVVGLLNLGETDNPWTNEDLSLVQAVADQIGVAMENARLLEQTNKRAEREHMVTEITARLRASNDPQVILQTAAQELRKALRASTAHVIIPSKVKPENGGNGKSQTSEPAQEESTTPADSVTGSADLPEPAAEPVTGETTEAEPKPESGSILAS
jgi:GAF domain-containing protein